jgi:hypothetical protein
MDVVMGGYGGRAMNKIKKSIFPVVVAVILLAMPISACNYPNAPDVSKLFGAESGYTELKDQPAVIVPDPGEPGDPGASGVEGYLQDEPVPANPVAPGGGMPAAAGDGSLKPVRFINYGSINATVRPWTYIPLGSQEYQSPSSASTVSSAQGSGGDWPNTSSYISVPMGTYSWCIDWEEEDQDEDGYFDYYHYIETGPTLLDENVSDDLEFAEEVSISAPPDTAPISKGKCGSSEIETNCAGKTTYFQSLVRNVTMEPRYPLDVTAVANTADQEPPPGISISASNPDRVYYANIILNGPGSWIEATTSDPYSAMGVQIFGDMTIGWARVLFDGNVMWEGDTSTCVIDPNENSGLGWYGIYVEALCFPPGTHTIRVESGPNKEDVGGWQGGVPVYMFGFRR